MQYDGVQVEMAWCGGGKEDGEVLGKWAPGAKTDGGNGMELGDTCIARLI